MTKMTTEELTRRLHQDPGEVLEELYWNEIDFKDFVLEVLHGDPSEMPARLDRAVEAIQESYAQALDEQQEGEAW